MPVTTQLDAIGTAITTVEHTEKAANINKQFG